MAEVVVVGGGVAGCSAAISLAQQGRHVLLIEAKTYPHHKVCGEFLSPECHYFLDSLGALPALNALQPVPITVVELTTPHGVSWEAALPGTAWGISRYSLDAALVEQARAVGVDVREGTTVTEITGDLDSGFGLSLRSAGGETRDTARAVIGAHGKRSALDRALNRRFLQQDQPFVGLKAHFCGPPLPQRIELHIFSGGYCGMSEIEGGRVNVCLLVRQPVFQRAGGIEPFIDWMQAQNPRLRQWLSQSERVTDRWYSIAQVPFGPKRAVVNDILMAGDSAGLIAPLAGDGMAMALRGGQIAAQQVTAYLQGQMTAADLRRVYPAAWKQTFGSRLRLGRLLQTLMLRPPLVTPVLRLIHVVPPLGDYLIRQTRDSHLIEKRTVHP